MKIIINSTEYIALWVYLGFWLLIFSLIAKSLNGYKAKLKNKFLEINKKSENFEWVIEFNALRHGHSITQEFALWDNKGPFPVGLKKCQKHIKNIEIELAKQKGISQAIYLRRYRLDKAVRYSLDPECSYDENIPQELKAA